MAARGRVSRRAQAGPSSPGKTTARKVRTVSTKNRGGADSQLTASLRWSRTTIAAALLHRSGNAAVLADAPEVHGHQDGGHDGDPDAVQDIEADERAGCDAAP